MFSSHVAVNENGHLLVYCSIAKNMSLNDSMQIVESAIEKFKLISEQKEDDVNKKMHAVTENNLTILILIKSIMSGRHLSKTSEFSPSDSACFKFASITPVDVELSFSVLKNTMRSNRRHNIQ